MSNLIKMLCFFFQKFMDTKFRENSSLFYCKVIYSVSAFENFKMSISNFSLKKNKNVCSQANF